MKTYQVQPGDTLFALARRQYGDSTLYPVIAKQNHLANPDLIVSGQQLLIPYVTYRHFVTASDSTASRQAITQQYYGTDDTNVQLIWEIVNGVAQREIHLGAWLHIPDLTDVGHHTVVAGESLEALAARWYGDDHLAIVIGLANNLPANTEPDPGQVLIVPGLNRRHHVMRRYADVTVPRGVRRRRSGYPDVGRRGRQPHQRTCHDLRQPGDLLPLLRRIGPGERFVSLLVRHAANGRATAVHRAPR